MRRLHAFLEEMDEEWVRRHHRRRAQEMAARMSLSSGRDSADSSADVYSRHAVARRTGSRPNGRASQCAGRVFFDSDMVSLPPVEAYTVQALMDMALPHFCRVGGWASAGPRAMGDVD